MPPVAAQRCGSTLRVLHATIIMFIVIIIIIIIIIISSSMFIIMIIVISRSSSSSSICIITTIITTTIIISSIIRSLAPSHRFKSMRCLAAVESVARMSRHKASMTCNMI